MSNFSPAWPSPLARQHAMAAARVAHSQWEDGSSQRVPGQKLVRRQFQNHDLQFHLLCVNMKLRRLVQMGIKMCHLQIPTCSSSKLAPGPAPAQPTVVVDQAPAPGYSGSQTCVGQQDRSVQQIGSGEGPGKTDWAEISPLGTYGSGWCSEPTELPAAPVCSAAWIRSR